MPAAKTFRLTFCKEMRDGFSGILCPLIFLLCKLLVGSLQTLCGVETINRAPYTNFHAHAVGPFNIDLGQNKPASSCYTKMVNIDMGLQMWITKQY